jgi:hypothetical protein
MERDVPCVFEKNLNLRTSSGKPFNGRLLVYECDEPFRLIFKVHTEGNHHEFRMDVSRDDLAKELREWLDGKPVRNPLRVCSDRTEEVISMFVRLGQIPDQKELLMWILSRTEIEFGATPKMILGGTSEFTGSNTGMLGSATTKKEPVTSMSVSSNDNYDNINVRKEFPKTAAEYVKMNSSMKVSVAKGVSLSQSKDAVGADSSAQIKGASGKISSTTLGINPTTSTVFQSRSQVDDNLKTRSTTRQLVGRSIALDSLEKHSIKGRNSGMVYHTKSWTSDHFRLVGEITRARHDIEDTMDERRRILETSKARQAQATEKYSKIRNRVNDAVSLNTWVSQATHELETYQHIQSDIDVEVLKQKGRSQRIIERTRWTIAPNGFVNRRGRYQKGPYLGEGPLPAEATSKLRDVHLEDTLKHFYWDSAGRRHERVDYGHHSINPVEIAVEAIKKASANIQAYKLDLKVSGNFFYVYCFNS